MPCTSDPIDWLIIGGGIHGVHVAVRLIAEAAVPANRIAIIDPGARLLANWHRCTQNTGMQHLRSPGVHHLGIEPFELLAFGGANTRGRGADKGEFAAPYARPSLQVFNAHCEWLIAQHGLQDRHIRDRATQVDLSCDAAVVSLASGAHLSAGHVVLALGASNQPCWPDWAQPLKASGVHVHHLFDPGLVLVPADWPERVAVVGGGISGVQAAMRLVDDGHQVTLVSRHRFRAHQFDSDSGWVGPKNMRRFIATKDLTTRRSMIQTARHRGSVTPQLHRRVRHAIERGDLIHHIGEVASLSTDAVALSVGDTVVNADALLLATGFVPTRPGGSLVDHLIDAHALPCAHCGYPVVDQNLRWHARVFVTGPLAELEIGPVSRNIVGARRAAERIVPVAAAS